MKMQQLDPRVPITQKIGSLTIGIFAIYAVFSVNISVGIPIVLLLGQAIAVAAIWKYGRPDHEIESVQQLESKIKELEQRIEAVEVIERFEDRLALKQVKLETKQNFQGAALNPSSREDPAV